MADKYSYYKLHKNAGTDTEPFAVKGYGEYPESSVNFGMVRIATLRTFPNEKAARVAYPQLPDDGTEWGSKYSDRELTRLPDNPPDWFDPNDAGEVW